MTEEKNFEMNELNEQALEETAGGSKNYDYAFDIFDIISISFILVIFFIILIIFNWRLSLHMIKKAYIHYITH